jgi:hypothetical protein
MRTQNITEIWQRITDHAGETFRQIRGGEFTYTVDHKSLRPDRTNWTIPKTHFDRALELVPLDNTRVVQHLFGPSYIYAVLMDPRIRRSDW